MQGAKLTERVRIEREIRIADQGGGAEIGWDVVRTIWASVQPLKGREQLEAMQLEASNLYRVTLRNDHDDLDASRRLVWLTNGHMVLNIREIAPRSPRDPMRVLVAEAGVDLQPIAVPPALTDPEIAVAPLES